MKLGRQTGLPPLQSLPQKEIVTMVAPSQNPSADVYTWITPQEWSALVDDPNTVVFDTRNSYVSAIGRFQSTMDPLRARGIRTTGVIDSKASPFRDYNQLRQSGRPSATTKTESDQSIEL